MALAKCYGKLAASTPARPLYLAQYLDAAAPIAHSASVRWDKNVSAWSVLLNDRLGDCVVAAGLHLRQCWTASAGGIFVPTDEQALAEYSARSGYDPSTGANDNGVDEHEFCKSWQTNGLVGDRCAGSCLFDYTNLDLLKFCIEVFGGVLIGTQVTQQCEAQTDAGQPWQDGWFPSPVKGLHGIPILGFDENLFYGNSWAEIVGITPEWVLRRFDEAHVIVDANFLKATGVTPNNLNLDQLLADMKWAAA